MQQIYPEEEDLHNLCAWHFMKNSNIGFSKKTCNLRFNKEKQQNRGREAK